MLQIYRWVTELTKNYHKTYNYSLGFFKKMTFDFSIPLNFEKTMTDWEHYNISSLRQRLLLFNTTEGKTEFVDRNLLTSLAEEPETSIQVLEKKAQEPSMKTM